MLMNFATVLSDQTKKSMYDAGGLDLLDDVDDNEVRYSRKKISRYFSFEAMIISFFFNLIISMNVVVLAW